MLNLRVPGNEANGIDKSHSQATCEISECLGTRLMGLTCLIPRPHVKSHEANGIDKSHSQATCQISECLGTRLMGLTFTEVYATHISTCTCNDVMY